MSTKAKIIEDVRSILKRAKTELYDKNGELNRTLFSATLDAFGEIKEHGLEEVAADVYALLDSKEEVIRKDAVAVLGFPNRLHMPEFRDRAYEIFLNDPDDYVKAAALSAWASYYERSDDKKIVTILYNILIDNNCKSIIRAEAYVNIFSTIENLFSKYRNTNTTPLIRSKTAEEFNRHMNWQDLESIMRKYAPEALDDSNE